MTQRVIAVCAAFAMLCIAPFALAQGGPPPGGFGAGGRGPGGPGPGEFAFMGPGGGFGGKVVTNAPFTATVKMIRTQTLADGNTINTATTGTVARDAQGRTYHQMSLAAMGPLASSGTPPQLAFISDPVAQINYMLNQNKKTAESFPEHKRGNRGNGANGANGGANPNWAGRAGGRNNANVTKQTVAPVTIGSVTAACTQITHTVPANTIGNASPIVSSVTRCFSADLQTVISETRTDPRFGTTTYQFTNITVGAPDAALFTVPADYTVTPGHGPGHGLRGAAKPLQP